MQLSNRAISKLAELVCGSASSGATFEWKNFKYRTSYQLTEFFHNCDMEFTHDGTSRKTWVQACLGELNNGPATNSQLPSDGLIRVIQELMDAAEFKQLDRAAALQDLNKILNRDCLEAYFDCTGMCNIRSCASMATSAAIQLKKGAWTPRELKNRNRLTEFLNSATEDQFTCQFLEPLFQQFGFTRITISGHKDKSLEFGKDLWMKFRLPTQHYLYFGVQVKRNKIDSAGKSKENVAEILNQAEMLLGCELFDPELNLRVLCDHVIIISASEITKAAKLWIGNRLDASKRRSIMFMDRDDLLDQATQVNLQIANVNHDTEFPF